MGAAASSRIRIFRGWLPRQVGLLPARGGETRIEGYARRSFWVAFFGRGFDSHHLHHLSSTPGSHRAAISALHFAKITNRSSDGGAVARQAGPPSSRAHVPVTRRGSP